MKTLLLIGGVLAASQCAAEPSDPATKSAPAGDVGITDTSNDSPDAGGTDAASSGAKLIPPGPPPFTVPTTVIRWEEQHRSVRVPLGTQVHGSGDRALVILGEGANFAYWISPATPPESAPVTDRTDGAVITPGAHDVSFVLYTGEFKCESAPDRGRYDRDDVEAMIASCLSIKDPELP